MNKEKKIARQIARANKAARRAFETGQTSKKSGK